MAEKDMADGKVLLHMGHGHMIGSGRVAGSSELRPGYVCTTTGNTSGTADCSKPDAVDDTVWGVVMCNANQDINSDYDDNDEFQVALKGGGHIVKCYAKANCGALKKGDPVIADAGNDNGYVIPYTVTSAPDSDTYTTSAMQTELDKLDAFVNSFVGIVWEDSDNDASDDRVIKVLI